MSVTEHLVRQVIMGITINATADARDAEQYNLGHDGVTRIEACTKSGPYANIPYVRVWKGDLAYAEFCQHNIVGVYFGDASANHVHTLAGAVAAMLAENEKLREALTKIEKWFGEFPETGRFWDKARTNPMSYSAVFGSNGERDYMRAIARAALSSTTTEKRDG